MCDLANYMFFMHTVFVLNQDQLCNDPCFAPTRTAYDALLEEGAAMDGSKAVKAGRESPFGGGSTPKAPLFGMVIFLL